MKKIFQKFYLLLIVTSFGFGTVGCGIHYQRLSYDINKWDTATIFSNSSLLSGLSKSKMRILDDSNSLKNFYQNCFVNENDLNKLQKIHQEFPCFYFMIYEKNQKKFYDVYIPMLPILKHAIINYENKTIDATNHGLNSIKKINQAINIKYVIKDDEEQEVYLKYNHATNGLIYQNDIFHANESSGVPNNALLLTKFIDSSNQTKTISVSSLLEFMIERVNNQKNPYYNFLTNQKFVITISWF